MTSKKLVNDAKDTSGHVALALTLLPDQGEMSPGRVNPSS
jgi:hypothetical protein